MDQEVFAYPFFNTYILDVPGNSRIVLQFVCTFKFPTLDRSPEYGPFWYAKHVAFDDGTSLMPDISDREVGAAFTQIFTITLL